MARINYKSLIETYNRFPAKAPKLLRESLAAKDISPRDFSYQALFAECFGWGEIEACRSDKDRLVTRDVFEAAGAVSTAAFKDISGQIIFTMTQEKYEDEEFVFSTIIPERQSAYTFEKVAGISRIGPGVDAEWVTDEGEPYQQAGIGQDWINLPETTKRGKIVALTREAVFFDRAGMVQERCGEVGYWLGVNKEIRGIDCVIDENGGAKSAAAGGHRYHWRDTSIATYGDSSGSHSWDNLAASNPLVDWTDVDGAEQLLNEIVDPVTGMPAMVSADTLIVTKQLQRTAERIVSSTQLHVVTPGYATTGNPTGHDAPNPYSGLKILTSKLLAQRLATDTSWFLGNPSKAFIYVVNFPFRTTQAPSNSEDEFNRDIIAKWKADERGAFGTLEPRLMVKNTVA